MCHVSVGHVARFFEAEGIPTVVVMVAAFAHVADEMKLPRVVLTDFPMGRPFGAPGDIETHRSVANAAVELLEAAGSRAIRMLDAPYRPGGISR